MRTLALKTYSWSRNYIDQSEIMIMIIMRINKIYDED